MKKTEQKTGNIAKQYWIIKFDLVEFWKVKERSYGLEKSAKICIQKASKPHIMSRKQDKFAYKTLAKYLMTT